ncbi:hypothetical protein U9M48_038770 [Paspalum notatum var. saurae]|uniref:Calcineurin subunit B n=1 Tax=Paspalum notatum var. saurae TaxID=547442 RepID=A0AAQ3XCD6_PASNO
MGSTSSMLTQYDIEEVQDHCNHAFSQQEIVSLYHRFCQLDRNGGGFVSTDEFMSVPEFAVNPLSQRLLRMLDGLNFKEFVAFLSAFSPHTSLQQKIEFIFSVYDTDCNGKVAFEDILSILRDLTGSFMTEEQRQKVLNHVLEEAGYTKDSHFTLPDFMKIIGNSELKMETFMSRQMANIECQSEPFTKMAENDTIQLQRAIFAQYIMMKKLFMELEVEREASATAANASMIMIRKLQKEKDSERMEAWQYKRIAEERMNHTDRALEILKEVMELKELEISYLRNQLQAYKHKLLDAGIDDSDIVDETVAMPFLESESVENICHKIKRNLSLPTLKLNKLYTDMDIKKNGVQSARSRLSDNVWEQISVDAMALEPKKSLSTDLNSTKEHSEEPHSQSSGALHDSHTSDEPSCCPSFSVVSHQTDVCTHSPSSGALHDSHTSDEPSCGPSSSAVSDQTDICSERAVQVIEDVECVANHSQLKDSCLGTEMGELAVHPSEVDPLQTPERSNSATDSSCTGSEIVKEEPEPTPTAVTKGRGARGLSRFAATRKVGSMNNVDRHDRRSSGSHTPRAGVERTRSRLKRVQSAKMVELNDPRTNKEQIIMLKEVYEQLGMIESHMRPSDSQESPRNDASLDSVMEAALSFSL